MTNDPQLAGAVARVRRWFAGAPEASIVRDLAIKGAETVEREHAEREQAIERLIARSTSQDGLDWGVLERIDELAWGE